MTKILYLDYDGVLHHEQVFINLEDGIHMKMPGHALFEWMPILEELIAPYPDLKIVLSTSWVFVRNFNFAKMQLSPFLQSRVIGSTFHNEMSRVEFAHMPRWMQISEHVSGHSPDAWFAIDDDPIVWHKEIAKNCIKTDGAKGISDISVQDEIRYMLGRLYIK